MHYPGVVIIYQSVYEHFKYAGIQTILEIIFTGHHVVLIDNIFYLIFQLTLFSLSSYSFVGCIK